MKLFAKKTKEPCCVGSCGLDQMHEAQKDIDDSGIVILGSGCAKCNALEKAVLQALNEMNISMEIMHITDFAQIASYGVMSTPALLIHGKIVSYGKVLSVEEVKQILSKVAL